MSRYLLLTMDGCGTCDDLRTKLQGHEVDEVKVTEEWVRSDDGRALIEKLKGQGIMFEDLPQCVLVRDDDKVELCETPKMPEFVPRRPTP